MTLLTRQQIIDSWSRQCKALKNSYCCPNCRDLLHHELGEYICLNNDCTFDRVNESVVEGING